MSEKAYALSRFDAQIKDDGTRTFVTLQLEGAEPVRFHVSLEGASVLAAQISLVCRKMVEKMVASGEAERRYGAKTPELPNPFRVLTARSGLSEDRTIFAMSLQTEEGPLLEFLVPAALARELLDSASDTAVDDPSSKPSSIN
jgi:hypothetical protein